ncbi:hypothetical protein GF340_00575 [Candidatus Peregrinibacteria bacterium]|nr:hypothetical protein [Candidatus Peregrinibacteria bacterium]
MSDEKKTSKKRGIIWMILTVLLVVGVLVFNNYKDVEKFLSEIFTLNKYKSEIKVCVDEMKVQNDGEMVLGADFGCAIEVASRFYYEEPEEAINLCVKYHPLYKISTDEYGLQKAESSCKYAIEKNLEELDKPVETGETVDQEQMDEPEVIEEMKPDESESQDMEGDFQVYNDAQGYGNFTAEGTIVLINEQKPFAADDERIDVLYFVMENAPMVVEAYYKDMVRRGNSINKIVDEKLYYRIGIMENGEIDSVADISADALNKIEDSLENETKITLDFVTEQQKGMGAPVNFSFASEIN